MPVAWVLPTASEHREGGGKCQQAARQHGMRWVLSRSATRGHFPWLVLLSLVHTACFARQVRFAWGQRRALSTFSVSIAWSLSTACLDVTFARLSIFAAADLRPLPLVFVNPTSHAPNVFFSPLPHGNWRCKTEGPPPPLHNTRHPKGVQKPWQRRYDVPQKPEVPPHSPNCTGKEQFESIAAEFLCPVCACTAVDAVSLMTCTHILCAICADDCTAHSYTKCPHAGCNLPFRRNEIVPNYRIRNVLALMPASAKQVLE